MADIDIINSIISGAKSYEERCRAGIEIGLNQKSMTIILETLHYGPEHCFVWPETYPQTYYYQRPMDRLAKALGVDQYALPVIMRSAKSSLFYKYGKSAYIARVVNRYLALYRVTKVDGPAWHVVMDLTRRLMSKHNIDFRLHHLFDQYRNAVIVEGRPIPMDRERLKAIEKAMEVIAKMDRLAA